MGLGIVLVIAFLFFRKDGPTTADVEPKSANVAVMQGSPPANSP